jgi:outer membrane protein TolC
MLGFTLPLQRSRRHAEERAADFAQKAAAARRDAMAAELAAALADSWTRHRVAERQRSLLHETLLPLSETNYRSALAGYSNGRGEFATVLEALHQRTSLQLDLLATELDLRLRALEIESLAGDES